MKKIMDGEAPANVAIDGDINIAVNDSFSPISNVKINLECLYLVGQVINKSLVFDKILICKAVAVTNDFKKIFCGCDSSVIAVAFLFLCRLNFN